MDHLGIGFIITRLIWGSFISIFLCSDGGGVNWSGFFVAFLVNELFCVSRLRTAELSFVTRVFLM
jgi:hypothetical protein